VLEAAAQDPVLEILQRSRLAGGPCLLAVPSPNMSIADFAKHGLPVDISLLEIGGYARLHPCMASQCCMLHVCQHLAAHVYMLCTCVHQHQ
jgi:hypothetical protein